MPPVGRLANCALSKAGRSWKGGARKRADDVFFAIGIKRHAPRARHESGQMLVAHEVYAHMGRPGPCALITWPCRRKRHMTNFTMLLHSKKRGRKVNFATTWYA